MPDDVRDLVRVVDRAEERVGVVGHADLGRALGVLGERGDEVVVDAGPGEHAGRGGAVLAGVEVAADGDALDGGLDVGVVEDDDRRLAAELEVDALEVARRALGHLHAGADRAGDRDERRRRVLDEHAAGLAVAGDDVEGALGQELRGELGEEQRRLGRRVGGLEDDGVARGERRGDLPHRHHHRVVPRRHLADDPDRLAAHEGGVALHVLPRRLALEHPRGAGEEAQLVEHRRDLLAPGQRVRLAGVLALEADEVVGACLDGVGELQQGGLALAGGRVTPRLERRRTRRHTPGRRPTGR